MKSNLRTEASARKDWSCSVGIDRVIATAQRTGMTVPQPTGFDVLHDRLQQVEVNPFGYRRIRNLKNLKTGTIVGASYQPAPPWLAPLKVTVTPGAGRFLGRSELVGILAAFQEARLIQVEVAFDFPRASGVDHSLALAHFRSGKSRVRLSDSHSTIYYGDGKSSRLVRAYYKTETHAYRIELQLNSMWLRMDGITTVDELCQLRNHLYPEYFSFVRFDWGLLRSYLETRDGSSRAQRLLKKAQARSYSLQKTSRYLRQHVGIPNPHRFLRRLQLNKCVRRGLAVWANTWGCDRGR